MDVLERCNSELNSYRVQVKEWMVDEEELSQLYDALRFLLQFIETCLDRVNLLYEESSLGGADEDAINELVIHVDNVRGTYRHLLEF